MVVFQNTTATGFTSDNFLPGYSPTGEEPVGETVTGDDTANALYGTIGGDTIDARGGNDTVYAGPGADLILGGTGSDQLYGEAGNDVIEGGDDGDTLVGGDGDDVLYGQLGNDQLYGEKGNDILDGGDGDDYLSDWEGSNTFLGGAGNDRIEAPTHASAQTIDAGADDDVITLYYRRNAATITTGSGADQIDLVYPHSGSAVVTVTDFTPGAGGDTLNLGASQGVLSQLSGWDGSSNPFGAGFLRLVQNGADTDLQWDQNGGGDAYVTMVVFQNTTATGFTSDNFLPGYPPTGTGITGSTITGTSGDDTLTGTIGDDVIDGQDGADIISGGNGNDQLFGGAGADQLDGGFGQDILDGGAGNDVLTGGGDPDRFVYQAPDEGIDTIVDFTPNEDLLVINVSAFGGGLVAGAALDASQLVASAGATAEQAHGQFLYDTSTGVLSWDADGTGALAPVQLATLDGTPLISASDFDLV
jgi:Ca2+-binding RTX toxin-like protein